MVVVYFFLRPTDLLLRDYFTSKFKDKPVPPIDWSELDLLTCIFFIILISTGMAIQVIRQSRAIERRALKAEAEKAQAELSFLKAQINPHFLYNTLNNIYSLSEDHHPDTSDSILKLSNLMRYITDEATQDFVPLESEVDCIRDYIDLQQLRLQENIKLTFSVTGNTEEKQIAPLILITYIENAFKYGISSHKEGEITIKVAATEEEITFYCRNKIFPTSRYSENTGIGLVNTRQRLDFLYPKKHKLIIITNNGFYTVELTLKS
jgi:LytS/YehU family sensor histidine kinase